MISSSRTGRVARPRWRRIRAPATGALLAACLAFGVGADGPDDDDDSREPVEKHAVRLGWRAPVEGAVVSIRFENSRSVDLVLRAGARTVHRENGKLTLGFEMTQQVTRVRGGCIAEERRVFHRARYRDREGEGDLPLTGRSVLVTRRPDGRVDVVYENDQPVPKMRTGAMVVALGEHELSTALEPDAPVAVGETWKLDTHAMARAFFGQPTEQEQAEQEAAALDLSAATAEATLVDAGRHDGVLLGTVEIRIVMPVTRLGALVLDRPLSCRITLRYTGCIDGSRPDCSIEARSVMKGSRQIETPDGERLDVEMDVRTRVAGESSMQPNGSAPGRVY